MIRLRFCALLASLLFSLFVSTLYAQTEAKQAGLEISSTPFGILEVIRKTASAGIRAATKGIRTATNVVRRGGRAAKNVARNALRGLKKSRNTLKRVRRSFTKKTRKIIAIARAGGSPPESLSNAAGRDAARILELEVEIQRLRAEVEFLKIQQELGL